MQNGVYTVVPTFFKNNNSIDYEALRLHLINLRNLGYNKFVFLGTTSETATLSVKEMVKIKDFLIENKRKGDYYIFGVNGNDPVKVINMITSLKYTDEMIDAIMLSSPPYNKPNQQGLLSFFSNIMKFFNSKNFLLYNIPSRTGVNVEPITFKILEQKFENFVGIKEASGDIKQITNLVCLLNRVKVFCGDDKLALPGYSVGTSGVISVASNLTNLVELIRINFVSGSVKNAFEINKQINKLYDILFIDSNPVPLKYILSKKYNYDDIYNVRPPLVSMSKNNNHIVDTFLSTTTPLENGLN